MEHFTFELILHFDPECVDSINYIKARVKAVLENHKFSALDGLVDIELNLIGRTLDKTPIEVNEDPASPK